MSSHDFQLEKWYLDCISDSGDAFIGYVAVLRWKSLKLPYSSLIHHNPGSGTKTRSRFRIGAWPEINDSNITWDDSYYKLSGHWEGKSEPLSAKLFESERGSLKWNCIQPRADVKFSVADKSYNGLGYVEKLVLTDYPWNIEMKSLRWGRFCSETHSIVWIQISAEDTKNWVWVDGKKTDSLEIDDQAVYLGNQYLNLEHAGVIESEKKIFNTIRKTLKALPGFMKIIPEAFLQADETKWLSRASLVQDGEPVSNGYAIHELVKFQ